VRGGSGTRGCTGGVLCDHLAKWSARLWKGVQFPGDQRLDNRTLLNLAGVSYLYAFDRYTPVQDLEAASAAYAVLRPLVPE